MNERLFFRKILTTNNFFFVLAENLDEMFSNGWIYDDLKDDGEIYPCCESTHGWTVALCATFKRFDLMGCWDWYWALDLETSDIIDGYIGSLLCAFVFDDDGNRIRKV